MNSIISILRQREKKMSSYSSADGIARPPIAYGNCERTWARILPFHSFQFDSFSTLLRWLFYANVGTRIVQGRRTTTENWNKIKISPLNCHRFSRFCRCFVFSCCFLGIHSSPFPCEIYRFSSARAVAAAADNEVSSRETVTVPCPSRIVSNVRWQCVRSAALTAGTHRRSMKLIYF